MSSSLDLIGHACREPPPDPQPDRGPKAGAAQRPRLPEGGGVAAAPPARADEAGVLSGQSTATTHQDPDTDSEHPAAAALPSGRSPPR